MLLAALLILSYAENVDMDQGEWTVRVFACACVYITVFSVHVQNF